MHDNQLDISAEVARTLIDRQFPQWRSLPVRHVAATGTDNAIYRVGDRYAARFPLKAGDPDTVRRSLAAEAQAAAELAGRTRFLTPEPIALGEPGAGYPLPWSVQTWLPGTVALDADPGESVAFARDLAEFITGVRSIPALGRTFSGRGRGGDLHAHDEWLETCFVRSEGLLDVPRLRRMWAVLRDLPRGDSADVMNHADLMPGNVLVGEGLRLAGVLDVGELRAADPALDLLAAWHLLEAARRALRATLGSSDLEWARGKAWAFQQSMGLVWYYADSNPVMAGIGRRTLDRLLADERPLPAPGIRPARAAPLPSTGGSPTSGTRVLIAFLPASRVPASSPGSLAGNPRPQGVPRVRTRPVPGWDGQAWTRVVSGPEQCRRPRMSIHAVQPSLASQVPEAAAATRLSSLAPLAEVIGGDLTIPLVHGGTARYVNLDYAASAPALRAVADRVAELLPLYSSVHRGAGYASAVCTSAYEGARAEIAGFVGARDDDVVIFTRNTTDALNLLAAAVPRRRPSAGWCTWTSSTTPTCCPGSGSGPATVRAGATRAQTIAAVEAELAASPAALLAVTGASNVTGECPPLAELTALAHRYGARIVVDGAQLVPHRRVSLAESGIDYLAFSGHKLYAPYGAGRAGRAAGLAGAAPPYLAGGGAVREVRLGRTEWAGAPARHEAGTPNVIGAVALAAACPTLAALGPNAVSAHERALVRPAGRRGSPRSTACARSGCGRRGRRASRPSRTGSAW